MDYIHPCTTFISSSSIWCEKVWTLFFSDEISILPLLHLSCSIFSNSLQWFSCLIGRNKTSVRPLFMNSFESSSQTEQHENHLTDRKCSQIHCVCSFFRVASYHARSLQLVDLLLVSVRASAPQARYPLYIIFLRLFNLHEAYMVITYFLFISPARFKMTDQLSIGAHHQNLIHYIFTQKFLYNSAFIESPFLCFYMRHY